MQKWKNKAGVRLSALDKKKLVLTNLPYVLTAFYADRASCLYRSSPGEDIGNKLLYAMEHADRIFTGILLSFDLRDLLVGVTVAVILKLLVWQKQSDAKKLRKGIEYGSARWGTAEDIKPYMSDDPWMNIPLTATEKTMPLSIPQSLRRGLPLKIFTPGSISTTRKILRDTAFPFPTWWYFIRTGRTPPTM